MKLTALTLAAAVFAAAPAMAQEIQSTHEWCYNWASLHKLVAEKRDQGVPLSIAMEVFDAFSSSGPEAYQWVTNMAALTYQHPSLTPEYIFEQQMNSCVSRRSAWEANR